MLWYVAFGSAVGGVSRYLLGGWVQRTAGLAFPVGTLAVNVLGSFALGVFLTIGARSAALDPHTRAMLTVGFCGGFTTFSTFGVETVRLVEHGDWPRAALYVALSVGLGVAATMLGLVAGRG